MRSVSRPSTTRMSVGTVSISWCQETASCSSWTTAPTPSGKAGSSCVYTVSDVSWRLSSARTGATRTQVGQSRFTTATMPSGSDGFSTVLMSRGSPSLGLGTLLGIMTVVEPAGLDRSFVDRRPRLRNVLIQHLREAVGSSDPSACRGSFQLVWEEGVGQLGQWPDRSVSRIDSAQKYAVVS